MKDNKAVLENQIAFAKTAFDNDENKIKIATDVAKECENETDVDRCETALKYLSCVEKAYKSRGINMATDW